MLERQTRAPKQLGDFGEGLVTYTLIRKDYEVAVLDHVGADLIAEKNGQRIAISVKTRMFKIGSKESLVFVVEKTHLKKLKDFSTRFGLRPVFALVLSLIDEGIIHLLIMPVEGIERLPKVTHGYSLRFSPTKRNELMGLPFVDYSCWKETLGNKDVLDVNFSTID